MVWKKWFEKKYMETGRKFWKKSGTEGTGTPNSREEKGPGPEFDTGTRPRRSLHWTPFKNIGEKKL